jgi:hypothetical protein
VAEASIQVPAHWEKQQEDLSVVPLKPSDPEYQQVEKNFNETRGSQTVKVTGVCNVSRQTSSGVM